MECISIYEVGTPEYEECQKQELIHSLGTDTYGQVHIGDNVFSDTELENVFSAIEANVNANPRALVVSCNTSNPGLIARLNALNNRP